MFEIKHEVNDTAGMVKKKFKKSIREFVVFLS